MWIPGSQHKKKGAAFSHAETHISEGIFKSSKSWCMDSFSLSLANEDLTNLSFYFPKKPFFFSFFFTVSGIKPMLCDYISLLLLHLMSWIEYCCNPLSRCYISAAHWSRDCIIHLSVLLSLLKTVVGQYNKLVSKHEIYPFRLVLFCTQK